MNEITKLYESLGIKKVRQTNITGGDYPIVVGFEDYPPFTAEKQIELIKWLSKDDVVRIEKYTLSGDNSYELSRTLNGRYDDYKYSYTAKKFEEALAGLINIIWQDLTEEDRTQIKEILE